MDIRAGRDLPIIGKLLGHAKSATTERYAHLDTSSAHTAADVVAQQIEEKMRGPSERTIIPFKGTKSTGKK